MANISNNEDFWDDEDEVLSDDSFAIHPGLLLKNVILPQHGVSASTLADRVGVARPGFNLILNGKRTLTSTMALKIEGEIGYPAKTLVLMMANHDLAIARLAIKEKVMDHIII